jgi:hypothetical protein
MPALADLHRAVEATLAGKRLGTPIFVRYLFHGAGANLARLAQTVTIVRGWLDQEIERIYAVGSLKGGQLSLTLECRGGATALVGWSAGGAAGGGVDVTLLGNHGALFHDAGADQLWDEPLTSVADKPDRALVAWIERALRSGRPEAAEGGAP